MKPAYRKTPEHPFVLKIDGTHLLDEGYLLNHIRFEFRPRYPLERNPWLKAYLIFEYEGKLRIIYYWFEYAELFKRNIVEKVSPIMQEMKRIVAKRVNTFISLGGR